MLISFLGTKSQLYLALISVRINIIVEIIVTRLSFDRFQLYRELDKFLNMRNEHQWILPSDNLGNIQ